MISSLRYSRVVSQVVIGVQRKIAYLWYICWLVQRMYDGVLVVLWRWMRGRSGEKYCLIAAVLYEPG